MAAVDDEIRQLRVELEVLNDCLSTLAGALGALLQVIADGTAQDAAEEIRQEIVGKRDAARFFYLSRLMCSCRED